jgi:hypothetical protein
MRQHPFGETLRELVQSVQPAGIEREQIRVVSAYFDVPLEVSILGKGDAAVFLGDLPNWRWRTAFDIQPGRMRVQFVLGESQ